MRLGLPLRTSDDKVMYVAKGKLLQRYLCALSYADAGIPLRGQIVKHTQTEDYYSRLLGLRAAQTAPALEDASASALPPAAFQQPQPMSDDGFQALPAAASAASGDFDIVAPLSSAKEDDDADSLSLPAFHELFESDEDDEDVAGLLQESGEDDENAEEDASREACQSGAHGISHSL